MTKHIAAAGVVAACVGTLFVSSYRETRAEEDVRLDVPPANPSPDQTEVGDAVRDDYSLATRIALLIQEEIGWNEFAVQRLIDPAVQDFSNGLVADRQRILDALKPFAPNATETSYLNKTAKDARESEAIMAQRRSAADNGSDGSGERDLKEGEFDRLARPTSLDRDSAWAAEIASFRGGVAAAYLNSTGLQSPLGNPRSDNLINNPAGILPGVTEGGSLFPPMAIIKAPHANSGVAIDAVVGVGSVAQVGTGGDVIQGVDGNPVGKQAGNVGAAGAGNVASSPTAPGSIGSNRPSGLFSGPAAGVQGPQVPSTSTQNPTGLLSGPAAGVQGPQVPSTATQNPTGLLSGPAAGVQGPQVPSTSTQNPTGLFSGPAAGVQGPQVPSTSTQNPTGLFSGPAAGVQGPQVPTTSTQNPTGLFSGPAAGVQGPQVPSTSTQNPSGLFSGPAAGVQGPQVPSTSTQNPTGLLSGPAAGVQGPQAGTTSTQNPTGLLSGPAAGTQGPQSVTASTQNPSGLLSGQASDIANPTAVNQRPSVNTVQPNVNLSTRNTVGELMKTRFRRPNAALSQPPVANQNSRAQTNNPPLVGLARTREAAKVDQVQTAGGDLDTPQGTATVNRTTQRANAPVAGQAADLRLNPKSRGDRPATSTVDRGGSESDADDRGNRDFDVILVHRQTAVQSLAASKWLLENSARDRRDHAFLMHELEMQKSLLDQIVVFRKFASNDLERVLKRAEATVRKTLHETQQMVEDIE